MCLLLFNSHIDCDLLEDMWFACMICGLLVRSGSHFLLYDPYYIPPLWKLRSNPFFIFIFVGVGKTSLVHLIVKGSSSARPPQTIGCTVGVKVWFNMALLVDNNFVVYCLEFKIFNQVLTITSLQHISYGNSSSSSSSIKGDSERDFFVELWDVSGHDRYKDCRSLFYSQINGECRFFFMANCIC